MDSKRSYLDTLNAGRPRRPQSSLEELNRTFETLEGRFDAGWRRPTPREEGDDIAQRMQRLAGQAGSAAAMPGRRAGVPRSMPQSGARSFGSLAREIERARVQEEGMAAVGQIAQELKSMREELRHQMTAGLRREFDALRQDIEHAYAAAAAGEHGAELGLELERLSGAIQSLAERSDDNSVNMLRLEVEQVKGALDTLAREETVRSVGRDWEDFGRRWDASEKRRAAPDPAIDALNARLEQINEAVNSLPESLSLRSLEEKVRTLSGVIDQFSRQQEHAAPEAFEMIAERLDEISRAIVASSLAAPVASFDPQPFERIEARITSLARQIEELADDRPVRAVMDGLAQLSERVDEVSRRADIPEKMVKKLAQQIAAISEKLDTGHTGHAADADRMLHGFESRFAGLSAMLERRQNDASEQGQTLFRDLERRLESLAERLDRRNESPAPPDPALMDAIEARFAALSSQLEAPGDSEAIRNLEARLEDISSRLDQSARHPTGIDPELIRNLEAQVAGLSEHLARPGHPMPDFEDIGPRLDDIEKSIAQNRDSILSAARQAAEEAIRGFSGSAADEAAVSGLAGDLKSLETLARRSDERNTKTFEAIHDTLLKIVDRLGTLETRQVEPHAPALPEARHYEDLEEKLALDHTPSIDPDGFEPDLADDAGFDRSPSEAAAAAALAALAGADGEVRQAKKQSRLGGLRRALSGRREEIQPVLLAGSESVDEDLALAPEIDLDEPLDPKVANRPLEPGSGAPDLSAIMKRVRDDRAQTPHAGSADAAKSDFIAAARRAAQAAAAEAEILKRQADKKSTGSGKFSLGDLFRRRKSLLMAAGAILIALAGLQAGKAFLADAEQIAADDTTVFEQQAEETAALEEEAAAEQVPDAVPAMTADAAQQASVETPVRSIDLATASAPAASQQAAAVAAPAQAAAAPEPAPEATATPPVVETIAAIVPEAVDIPAEAGPVALRDAAAGGDAKAMFEIGSRYSEGRGIAESRAEAARWYQKSADLGFAPAQYRIGNMYEKGLGVARDVAKAKTWYQLAAEQGNASAMHNLAVLFAMGADGAPDNDSAARWFADAAELGVTDSQFNLGILAAKGAGVPQNLEEAYKWFALVAKTGDKDAAAKRDEVAGALIFDKLERARAATELWKAKPLDPDANAVEIPDSWKDGEETTAGIDVKQAVRNIQMILSENGYDAGGADGIMGAKTKTAIAAFQKENGLPATGEVDQQLVQALIEKK